MRKITLVLLLLTSLLMGLSPQTVTAQSQSCVKHFADGKAPAFTRASLQNRSVAVCYEAFAVMHSGVSRTPLWSAEHLTRHSLVQAREIKRKDAFHADENLPSDQRAELPDYARSGYDRGHMSPAADMPTEESQHQSFSLANIVPQNREHNQILWAAIEGATRHLVNQRGELYVITGPVFEGDRIARINERVFIPTHIFKAIYDPEKKEGAAWLSPNSAGDAYQVISLADLEKRIGITLFPSVSSEVKSKMISLPEPRLRSRK
jgi:endonuclease G